MIRVRANQLKHKSTLKELLFNENNVRQGDSIAKIVSSNGLETIIYSPTDGKIVKTARPGTVVKNGSVIAILLTRKKELLRFENRTKFSEEDIEQLEKDNTLSSQESDQFSGSVVYDKNYQAKTPYSNTKGDIMSNYKNNDAKNNASLTQNTGEKSVFDKMRENIASSVGKKVETNNEEIIYDENGKIKDNGNSSAIFKKDNRTGQSPFRALVNARKQELHTKNDYHNPRDKPPTSAMDYLGEDGKPKILRNLVHNRLKTMDDVYEISVNNAVISENNSSSPSSSNRYETKEKDDAKRDYAISSPTKTYRDRLYEKLNDDKNRQRILSEKSGLALIRERKSMIEKGEIEAESFINDHTTFYKRPDLEEETDEKWFIQKRLYNVDLNKDEKSNTVNKNELNNINYSTDLDYEVSDNFANNKQNNTQPVQSPNNHYVNPLPSQNFAPLHNANHQSNILNDVVPSQIISYDNSYSSQEVTKLQKELEDLKEKLKQQQEEQKYNAILQEIKNIQVQQNNQQPVYHQNDEPLSKMMQYMMMQNMLNNMNQQNKNSDLSVESINKILSIFNQNSASQNNNQVNQQISSILENLTKLNQHPHANNNNNLVVKKLDENNNIQNHVLANMSDNIITSKPDVSNIQYFNAEDNNKREPIKKMRHPAVKSMILSQNYIPPLTITCEVDMSTILKMQAKLRNTSNESGIKFSSVSFIVKAISLALIEYPKLNSSYDPKTNEIIIKHSHNIGLATETSEGLIVPVIRYVERLTLKQVAVNIQETIERLRQAELSEYEMNGSTITMSNYGPVGATQATSTIFYPNAALISAGRIVRKPIVIKNDKVAVRSVMVISLSVDQRIIDAAEAGAFLTRLKELLEYPELLSVS